MPTHLTKTLILKSLSYQLVHGVLFIKQHNGVFLKCLGAHDSEKVLCDLHYGPIGDILWETQLHIKSCGSVLLVHVVQICSRLCTQVSVLSNVCWLKQEVNPPITTYRGGRTFSTTGIGCQWRNISAFVKVTPLYSHCHILLYTMDRSNYA